MIEIPYQPGIGVMALCTVLTQCLLMYIVGLMAIVTAITGIAENRG